MKIQDLLLKEAMIMNLQATTKEAAIDEMVNHYASVGVISDKDVYRAAILKRESESTTGIGDGIAMPHAKNSAVKRAAVLFAKSAAGVEYNSLDGQPVHLFFMIAAPEGANNEHLQALAALSSLLIDPKLVQDLKQAQTPDEVLALFNSAEAAKEAIEAAANQAAAQPTAPTTTSDEPFVVAVTACPTGIAHTYMAEAALIEEAKKMGVAIRVETNGSEGVKHRLTADEIAKASGVIIAADKKVEMARFNGKPLLNRPVIEGIKKPHELIEKAVQKEAPIYHNVDSGDASETNEVEEESIGRKVYASLMNGVSNMLPFVVGGGILLAISFLLERTAGAKSMWFTFPNQLGSAAFGFLVPVLAAYIAEAIGDRPALMPGFVAGWMAANAQFSVLKTDSPAGFLGGLVGGFVAGYIILVLKKLFKDLPKSLDGLKPVFIFPVLSLIVVGAIMFFAVDPIFAAINHALTGFLNNMGTANAVVLGALLGGMMSVDMGGPVNKAAYVFAIGSFQATNNGALMAAVMAGGMVPPLAIALATTIWPKKWTEQERTAGIGNYVLGLSFITEGAIPFAASDPLRVISSGVVGSAIAGALTQLMHVNVPAPHGGIFAALLANNGFAFIFAVVVGALISAAILGFWKKELVEA